jgi:LysR family glycine cleavage system transcriptional activator
MATTRLPPLKALRAFEAAARHVSFLKAAEELHVTAGAVSQQVKALEEELGAPLFRRLPRGVALTRAGQRYGRQLGELFDGIAEATRQLREDKGAVELTINAMPSFEVTWLIPRLGAFNLANPDISVRVLSELEPTDFTEAEADLAIHYGRGDQPGVTSEWLLPRLIFPVCSPKLAAGPQPIRRIADLAQHTLLHEEPYYDFDDATWPRWFDAVGAKGVRGRAGPVFTYSHMALQACRAGQGVALGTEVLAGDDILAGRLVRPLREAVESGYPYWLVYPPAALKRPKVKRFRDWVQAEATRFRATLGKS